MQLKSMTIAGILLTSVATAACSTDESVRGFVIDEEVMSSITPGIDNVNSVRSSVGNPSITSTFNDRIWYYISIDAEQKPFFRERNTDRSIVQIVFDSRGVVEDIQNYTMADGYNINPVNDETPTRGKKMGLLEQIFGNIGRFAPAQPGTGPGF